MVQGREKKKKGRKKKERIEEELLPVQDPADRIPGRTTRSKPDAGPDGDRAGLPEPLYCFRMAPVRDPVSTG